MQIDQQQRKNRQAYEISGFLRQNVLFEEAYGSQEDQISKYLRSGYYERIENKEIDKAGKTKRYHIVICDH